MIYNTITSALTKARAARDMETLHKLKTLVAEIDRKKDIKTDKIDDSTVEKMIRKFISSNEETIKLISNDTNRVDAVKDLKAENILYKTFLPELLDEETLFLFLEGKKDEICAALNDGAAMGIAMKHLKEISKSMNHPPTSGKDVSAVVKKMRNIK